jgi:hypothetical protein
MMKKQEFEINWKKCKNCGFIQHHSHIRCLKCKNEQFTITEPSGKATLISYTILKAPPMEFRDKHSYALGIIEFENGIRLMGQIKENADLEIGIEVKLHNETICKDLDGREITTYIFEPVKS